MSTSTQSATARAIDRIFRDRDQLRATEEFLLRYQDILVSLSEQVMTEKLGDDDDNMPYISYYANNGSVSITVHGTGQRDTMRTVRRAIGGKWRKSAYGERFSLSQSWQPYAGDDAPMVYVTIAGERSEVCQKVVTGTTEVHHEAVPAQPAHTEIVEEVDWVCGNLLDD